MDFGCAKWKTMVIRNIISALNNVIEKGRGTPTQVAIIAAEMKFKENNYASARIGDYFFLFKRVAYEKRQFYFIYHEDVSKVSNKTITTTSLLTDGNNKSRHNNKKQGEGSGDKLKPDPSTLQITESTNTIT